MGHEALKLELIQWLTKLDDVGIIENLKAIKDSKTGQKDWWDDLSESDKASIQRGMKDIEEGRTVAHEDVKKKYGL